MFQPRECTVKEIVWNGEDRVTFVTDDGTWQGAKRKDFWNPDNDWESKIIVGSKLRMWTVQWSIILGFEIWVDGYGWEPVWCMANDFQTNSQRVEQDAQYVNFIELEGDKMAKLIDAGKSLEEIDKEISDDHSGNTYGWALKLAISKATNQENAEKIRKEHNKKYGVIDGTDKGGLVNPAVFTIGKES